MKRTLTILLLILLNCFIANAQIPTGMIEIFNKKDLSGWTQKGNPDAKWDIVDGILKPTQSGSVAGWIQFEKAFTDFSFYCEWMSEAGGNSGVQIDISDSCKEPVYDAIEFQIADDDNYSLHYNKDGYTVGDIRELSGSIYGIVGVSKKVYKGSNAWNSYLITSKGDSIKLWYNDVLVISINRNDYNKPFTIWGKQREPLANRPKTGYIGLQSHKGAQVYFRNIAVKDLSMTY